MHGGASGDGLLGSRSSSTASIASSFTTSPPPSTSTSTNNLRAFNVEGGNDVSYNNSKTLRMTIFSFDITRLSSTTQFAVCVLGVFFCYFFYAIVQEYMFKIEGFEYGLSLTFFQFVVYTILTYLQLPAAGAGDTNRFIPQAKGPMWYYALIGFLSICTIALSNISCSYLNYPTQVVFKSCKLLPVMLVGVVYLKKQYGALDYFAVVLLSFGIVVCSLASKSTGDVSMKFDQTGVVLISLALFADAFIGNVQEKVLKRFNCTPIEMMFFSKAFGSIYLLVAVLVRGELLPAISFFIENNLIGAVILFSSIGCVGEVFVMTLVKLFGALVTVITTSCRKVVTIVFSFILFPKPVSFLFIFGVFLVSIGVGLNVFAKQMKKKEPVPVVAEDPSLREKEVEMESVMQKV